MKKLVLIIIAIAVAALFFFRERELSNARAETESLRAELAATKAELQQAAEIPKADPKESERQNQERAELAKLRGEVSALRKEKADWQKNRNVAEAAAIDASQGKTEAATSNQAVEGMQWVEQVLNSPSPVKGAEIGNVRRKALNGEHLTDAERTLLLNMNNKAAEIEKSPEEFAAFQSAYIASLLGWNNDSRADQIKGVLNAATVAANTRGFDYHAPGQNADNWDEEQRALNTRATSAIQNLLKPEERAVFDRALIGVLGVDTGMGGAAK
jgi:hypothetical protein